MDFLFCRKRDITPKDIRFLEDLLNMPPENILDEDKIKILEYLQNYKYNKELVQIILRLISNIAIIEETIPIFVSNDVVKYIMSCLEQHYDSWIIQWLGASALWNLCRNNIARIHMKNHIEHLIKMIRYHKYNRNLYFKKVCHTMMGCLSNCALNSDNLIILSNLKIYDVVEEVIDEIDNCNSKINKGILSMCGALIANSSVSNYIDHKFLKTRVISKFINKLKNIDLKYLLSSKLLKHSIAALHNVGTCEGFNKEFTSAKGYEFLCLIHLKLMDNENISLENIELQEYIETLFITYLPRGLRIENETTSLHLCCYYNYHDLLLKFLCEEHDNFSSVDENGNTVLHKAVRWKKFGIISFLCAIGFDQEIKNYNEETIYDIINSFRNDETRELLESSVELGKRYYLNYKSAFTESLIDNEFLYPIDLVEYIFKYVNMYKVQYLKIYS
jgi:hypothetical protein